MKIKAAFLALALSAYSTCAGAYTTNVIVDGQSGPWLQSINPGLDYGASDNLAPTMVGPGFDFAPGGTFTFSYLSGLTSAYAGQTPVYTAEGDPTYESNDNPGSSGNGFPSKYIPMSQYPVFLNELVGAFANNGVVVGDPFKLGDGPTSVAAPAGANEILLGLNDDIFSDNAGSLTIQVTGPGAARPVGAPAPLAGAGLLSFFGAGGVAARRWAKRKLVRVVASRVRVAISSRASATA